MVMRKCDDELCVTAGKCLPPLYESLMMGYFSNRKVITYVSKVVQSKTEIIFSFKI